VSLSDEHASMVHRLGQSQLEHLRLQTTLQEIFDLKTQDVIELHAVLVQDTKANQTTQECVTLEQTKGILAER
jgi:hypothetical protein